MVQSHRNPYAAVEAGRHRLADEDVAGKHLLQHLQGEGAVAVAPGMPVQLPSGEQLGTVRDIVATRSGEIRQLVVDTKDGLTTLPAGSLTASGTALIAGQASGSASNEAPVEASGTE